MTAPETQPSRPPAAAPWKQGLLSWLHAIAAGALSALASVLDTTHTVLSFRTVVHAVLIGAAVRGIGWLIAKVQP